MEAPFGLRSPPKAEDDAFLDLEDANYGTQFLGLPEPAAALKQTMILGSGSGTWAVDSPDFRLMQR